MDHTIALSYKSTKLIDRVLWSDGDSTVRSDQIIGLISRGVPVNGLYVDEITAEIRRYNQLVEPSQRIEIKESVEGPNLSWNLPEPYLTLNPWTYIANKLEEYLVSNGFLTDSGLTEGGDLRAARVSEEIKIYQKLNLTYFLRTIIYVINTLREKNMVWGVGRGSSVSSYVLFLLGVHDVDSVAYGLNVDEFLRV